MIEEYVAHNFYWKDLDLFLSEDPHLSQLKSLPLVHPLDWWRKLDPKMPGIYILTGGRQIGKSTSTKLLIKKMLADSLFEPDNVFYLPCDQIDVYHQLTRILRTFFSLLKPDKPFLLIIDEVTFIKDWDRSIKALADEGWFRKGLGIITGSDSILLKEAASRFPGRRGDADQADFRLAPLSFRKYVELADWNLGQNPASNLAKLSHYFENYLQCGGFLRAINELHSYGKIREATYNTFEQWIVRDIEKRGKSVENLSEVLAAIFTTTTSQVTYSTLVSHTMNLSKVSFIEYCHLLERMDILANSEAFDQNHLRGFPKKARKFYLTDPFIFDTVARWLLRERRVNEGEKTAVKVESIVACDMKRLYPTYYIKAEGEVDVVIVCGKRFSPIEVKWRGQVRERDVKQIAKYRNGIILTESSVEGVVGGIKTRPLALFLMECDPPGSPARHAPRFG